MNEVGFRCSVGLTCHADGVAEITEQGLRLWITLEIFLRRKMIAAALFVVTPADIIRK